MRTRATVVTVAALWVLACSGLEDLTGSDSTIVDAEPVEPSGGTNGLPPAPNPTAATIVAPTDGSVPATVPTWNGTAIDPCDHRCAILNLHPFESVQQNYCDMCGDRDDWACEMDWPTNDVPMCGFYDEMRNCLYAMQGREFTGERWQELFGGEEWYQVNPNYSDDLLNKTAQDNAQFLRDAVQNQLACTPG